DGRRSKRPWFGKPPFCDFRGKDYHMPITQGLDVARGFLRGATKGGLVGGAASVATGAAIIVTTPAWLPLIGGAMAVSAATVAIWGTTGAGVGAAVGGTVEYARAKK